MSISTLNDDLNILQNLAIPALEEDVDVIQKLDDEPNDVGGLSAAELKAKFDEAGNRIKTYLNETLVPSISETVAEAEERAKAEEARVLAEEQRATAEQERVSAEAEREQAEAERRAGEAARVSAEEERAAAETARKEAEAARALAEQNRVDTDNGIVAQATKAAEDAETAKDNAEKAAETASSAAIHQPIVGDNQNWWTWNIAAGAYVDTGIYAAGHSPYIGNNGNWWIGAEDTGVAATGPQGPQGIQGIQGQAGLAGSDGQDGVDGKSAYQYAVEGGYTGTEEAFAAKMAGGGLTAAQIDLLEDAFEHIQWADDAGPQYAAQLIASLRGGESGGEQPEQPDTPKTLTGISAEYSGGNVAVGTELSSLSGITVTAHYSDGTTATVTGYTLSGTIAAGDNTITVTYMGKTATITVTGEAQSADDRTLLHNWILNDQNVSNIDTVSGATIGSSGITRSSDGWIAADVWDYIYAENVNGYNRSVECDIASSTVAEDLETGIFIGFGTVKKSPTHYISYRNKTWGWESTDTNKTEKVITDLVGANPFSSKTLALCVNAEGYIDLYLDGAYLSTSPWAVTAPNLVLGHIANGYAPFTVSGIRIYEGVL